MSNNNRYSCFKKLAIVLPSLDPDGKFEGVVNDLITAGFEKIVIIDDGSRAEKQCYFEKAAENPCCTVIRHGINKGKGRALKTAMTYLSDSCPEIEGAVTIDGDGQHLIEDIIACGEKMLENPDSVVLGCRDFDTPGVPPRSVAGNKTTSAFFRILFNIRLSDTQTGLRAIPAKYFGQFCEISGERFEYETNMLLMMKRLGIPFIEQPIATVYDPDDYSSHYKAVRDSLRIGKVMLSFIFSGRPVKYALSSFMSFLADNGLYFLLLCLMTRLGNLSGSIAALFSYIPSRALSSFFNFNLNRFWVFKDREGSYGKSLLKYYGLAIPVALVSASALSLVVKLSDSMRPFSVTAIKILIDAVLFVICYVVQKKWVFKKSDSIERVE